MECGYRYVDILRRLIKISLRILPQPSVSSSPLLSLVPPTPHRCGGAQGPGPAGAVGRRSALNSWTGRSASALLCASLFLCHMLETQAALCNSCQSRADWCGRRGGNNNKRFLFIFWCEQSNLFFTLNGSPRAKWYCINFNIPPSLHYMFSDLSSKSPFKFCWSTPKKKKHRENVNI